MARKKGTDPKADFRRLVLSCAAADPDATSFSADFENNPAVTRALALLFRLIAQLQKTASDWTPDHVHPGYLIHSLNGATMVAPFHLIADLPQEDALDDLRSVAAAMKVGEYSAICLSGSAVALGDPRCFGDLDFCEYIPEDEATASIGRLAGLAQHGRDGATCTEIKIRSYKIERPWEDRCRSDALRALLGPVAAGASGKADYVLERPTTGPVEATNVMVWVTPGQSDADAARLSFPYQEVDVGSTAAPWIPRRLDRPSNIARYVRFLRSDIEKHRRDKPVKALKRALSLASFLLLETHQEKILVLAGETADFETEALEQRRRLVETLAGHADSALQALGSTMQASLDRWLDGRGATRHDLGSETFGKRADELIGGLLHDVDAASVGV